MSRWRISVLLALFLAPFLFLIGAGGFHLWDRGWMFYAWWPMTLCFTLAFGLGWYWQRRRKLLPAWEFETIPHGSVRDQEAWKLVEQRAKEAESIPSERFTEPGFYMTTGKDLALAIARFYHPAAQDPYSMLTIPELLAVAELAAHDLTDLVKKYVPGSHLLTVEDYKRARQAVDWYRRANSVYWAVSAIFSPIETAARFIAARIATGQTLNLLQQNVLLWFYTAFLHRLGTYLIELHSGRLRIGVERYRELMDQHTAPPAAPTEPSPAPKEPVPAREVTIALLGQVKAGKSSLVNALLGERKALTDVLPLTNEITSYRLQPPGVESRLALLDTPGYGHEGPREDQVKATEQAARQADALLLVLHARNPARKADVAMLDALRSWFARDPNLRMPPIIAVLTHVDLLTPAMEWAPPYDWRKPTRLKEQQMHEAVLATAQQLGDRVAAIVPVCTASDRLFGIDDALLPALANRIGEARTVALLRCIKSEADAAKYWKVARQLIDFGKEAAQVVWNAMK